MQQNPYAHKSLYHSPDYHSYSLTDYWINKNKGLFLYQLDLAEKVLQWGGSVEGKPIVSGLEKFAMPIINSVWNSVRKQYPDEVRNQC
jgi:hypothetical protein